MNDFLKEIDITISVCDSNGTISYLNNKGLGTFEKDGGKKLIGRNLLDCHPEPSKSRLHQMMLSHETQSYFKGKRGKKRLIHQTPIYKNGVFDGYIEFIIPLPGVE